MSLKKKIIITVALGILIALGVWLIYREIPMLVAGFESLNWAKININEANYELYVKLYTNSVIKSLVLIFFEFVSILVFVINIVKTFNKKR